MESGKLGVETILLWWHSHRHIKETDATATMLSNDCVTFVCNCNRHRYRSRHRAVETGPPRRGSRRNQCGFIRLVWRCTETCEPLIRLSAARRMSDNEMTWRDDIVLGDNEKWTKRDSLFICLFNHIKILIVWRKRIWGCIHRVSPESLGTMVQQECFSKGTTVRAVNIKLFSISHVTHVQALWWWNREYLILVPSHVASRIEYLFQINLIQELHQNFSIGNLHTLANARMMALPMVPLNLRPGDFSDKVLKIYQGPDRHRPIPSCFHKCQRNYNVIYYVMIL